MQLLYQAEIHVQFLGQLVNRVVEVDQLLFLGEGVFLELKLNLVRISLVVAEVGVADVVVEGLFGTCQGGVEFLVDFQSHFVKQEILLALHLLADLLLERGDQRFLCAQGLLHIVVGSGEFLEHFLLLHEEIDEVVLHSTELAVLFLHARLELLLDVSCVARELVVQKGYFVLQFLLNQLVFLVYQMLSEPPAVLMFALLCVCVINRINAIIDKLVLLFWMLGKTNKHFFSSVD